MIAAAARAALELAAERGELLPTYVLAVLLTAAEGPA